MADAISIWSCALAGGEGFTSDSMGQACGHGMSNLQPRVGPIILDTLPSHFMSGSKRMTFESFCNSV